MTQLMFPINGKNVPVYHTFGKEGFESPPIFLQQFRKLKYEIAKKLAPQAFSGIRAKGNTDKLIVQKWQEKYVAGYGNDPVAKLSRLGYNLFDIARKLDLAPLELRIAEAIPFIPLNTFLIEGINEIWDDVTAVAGTTEYDNTNARVGVGNSASAVVDSQTGLQGASTAFAAMDVSFPASATDKRADFKGTYASGTAEFAWEEYTVDNGNTRNKNIFRALQSNGTKASGQTWTLECRLTIA